MGCIQKLAICKKSTFFVLFLWNLVKIITSSGDFFQERMKIVDFLLMVIFWKCFVFHCPDFTDSISWFLFNLEGLLIIYCRMPSANHASSDKGAYKNVMLALADWPLTFFGFKHEFQYIASWRCGKNILYWINYKENISA